MENWDWTVTDDAGMRTAVMSRMDDSGLAGDPEQLSEYAVRMRIVNKIGRRTLELDIDAAAKRDFEWSEDDIHDRNILTYKYLRPKWHFVFPPPIHGSRLFGFAQDRHRMTPNKNPLAPKRSEGI